MMVRRLARPMLAAIFINAGIDTFREPERRAKVAEPVAKRIGEATPLPENPTELVKLNAAVQVAAGFLLALGRLPRLAASALAVSLVPTTVAGHRFWEEEDPARKTQQRVHFLKNVGLLGGLILASVDTAGAPSLSWRAKRAAKRVRTKVG
jgi:uncharacterized membrane protein YphA (DoxX/SURF4 family)